ncbi:hypothetical protein E2C01_036285 [Portunus trituberculatus]|uniref:Uncharacterized protein n=1 Tax=Portunus trituberculatus TaxID=210409 RepID=A0A5B7FC20_PORTR|nr:hypothetical protein [Portunus trituberculatus]
MVPPFSSREIRDFSGWEHLCIPPRRLTDPRAPESTLWELLT